ncbi:hypothetical protein CDAR_613901 [Caerostris darwini]|uniref:HAT C-terminal dimerisation domain-containing protein n=1 Tax=Caerostris darwini TaxID=1538125 RepID=A0AAV4MIC0_9ARAC|nr:hypothetical protein CDAR_613901 [Caerostris darwini]
MDFATKIVACDEDCCRYFDPASTLMSMVWSASILAPLVNAQFLFSTEKKETVYRLIIDWLQWCATVKVEKYFSETKQTTKNRHRGKLLNCIVYLQVNARPNVAKNIFDLLKKFRW